MKKFLFLVIATIMATGVMWAQNDVTQFMGIPIDGTKSEMIQKLREKGFIYTSSTDLLEGEFNGRNVSLSVVTNNNKVWRIVVYYAQDTNEGSVINTFNTLMTQFSANSKYVSVYGDIIPETEDISYEITIHNKRYEAGFAQIGNDPNISKRPVWFGIYERFGRYFIPIYYDNEYNNAHGEDL